MNPLDFRTALTVACLLTLLSGCGESAPIAPGVPDQALEPPARVAPVLSCAPDGTQTAAGGRVELADCRAADPAEHAS